MLELPITVRLPKPSEMPHRTNIYELLEKRKRALIVQGYDLKENRTAQLPYSFEATINVDNSRLWDLFLALSNDFPDDVSLVYGLNQDDVVTTGTQGKEKLLQELSKYKTELTQDCSLVFGLLYQTRSALIEITVTDSKYIRFLGKERDAFMRHMAAFNIKPIRGLEFIDEYPKIVEPLKKFIASSKRPDEVIKGLNRAFDMDT